MRYIAGVLLIRAGIGWAAIAYFGESFNTGTLPKGAWKNIAAGLLPITLGVLCFIWW